MPLSKITVRNFQIHRKTELIIHEGINIIAGSSGNGKSSVIRAIRWLCENSPRGFKFRRWKAPEKSVTSVSFVIDDETITRKRNATTNCYEFKGQSYKALKSDVPEDIAETLNISEFNIQRQFEGPFLFSKSSSEVAKMINSVAGIEVIDAILKETNSRYRKAKAEVTLLEGMRQTKKATMDSLKHFVGLKKSEEELLQDLSEYESISERIERLSNFLETLKRKIEKVDRLSDISSVEKKLSKLKNLGRQYGSIHEWKQETLERTISRLTELQNARRMKPSVAASIQKKISAAMKRAEKLQDITSTSNACKTAIHRREVASDKVSRNKKEAKAVGKQLADIKKEAGVCPLCGNNF